jgi:endonuclease-3
MSTEINWSKALGPLLKKYHGKPHPLEYENLYQLLVMVVLSAQSSDKQINSLSPELFRAFPDMEALALAKQEDLYPYINKVKGFANKAGWLVKIGKAVKTDKEIPLSMDGLTALPGIGRKSANVIMREAKVKAEGVIVDLHVIRVAPRIGITNSEDPKKIEKDIMSVIPEKDWGEAGMAISFLGREICRPSNPMHHECVLNKVCQYYAEIK